MKLTLAPREVLALHNLLEAYVGSDDASLPTDDAHLKQVHARLRAYVVSALQGRPADPVDAALAREQGKIDRLNDQLADIKLDQQEMASVPPAWAHGPCDRPFHDNAD